MNNKQYFVKASISENGKANSKLFRTIAIDGNKSLYNLAEWIIKSYDFDFDHPFGFYDNEKNPYNSTEGYELFSDMGEKTEFDGVKKTKISKVFTEVGKKLLFLFDYGDEWRFVAELLKIEDKNQTKITTKIVETSGRSPEQYPE